MSDTAGRRVAQGEMLAHLGASGLCWSEAGVVAAEILVVLGYPRAARAVRLVSWAVLVSVFTAYHLAAVQVHHRDLADGKE